MAHGGGRRCTVCDHPERSTIDKQLANNSTSKRNIATSAKIHLHDAFTTSLIERDPHTDTLEGLPGRAGNGWG